MNSKKDQFFHSLKEQRSAVLVGPMLTKDEAIKVPNSPLLLIDGGMEMALKHGLYADRSCFSLGDGDSSKSELDEKISPVKDYSDLAYALSLLPKEVQRVELFGFLGGRKDHELCNFGEVFNFLKKKSSPTLVNIGTEVQAMSSGSWNFHKEGSFSLISIEKLEVKLTGSAAYLLNEWTRIEAFSSHGLSNEGCGEIQLQIKSPVFLYGDGINIKLG